MDKQRYINFIKKDWLAENIITVYEEEDRAVYFADTWKYGAIAMKVNDNLEEILKEYTALDGLRGDRCATFYNCLSGEAIIVERIIPGISLREELDLEKRLEAFCETFKVIHKIPKNEKVHYNYLEWLENAVDFCVDNNIDNDLTEKIKIARDIGKELFDKYTERYLLHGDLHHDNILLKNDGKYSIIDPKGVIGPRIFDIPRFILNELDENLNKTGKEHILKVINKLASMLCYDEEDIRKLFFMETMLANIWCVEDDEDIDESAMNMAFEILQNI